MRRWLPVLVVAAAACAHTPRGAEYRPADPDYPVDVSLERLAGGRMHLSSLAGQVVVVSFFATWCLPCVAEVPYLNRLQARPEVTVVGIAMDQGGSRVLAPFVDEFGVTYPVLLADDPIYAGQTAFGPIPGIPTSFLIDQRGHVVTAVMGMLDPKTFDRLVDDVVAGRRKGTIP